MVTLIIDKLSLPIKQEEERKEKRNIIYVYNKISCTICIFRFKQYLMKSSV